MRDDFTRERRRQRRMGRPSLAWLWIAALFVLPGCSLNESGLLQPKFDPGPNPQSSTIFCDIEQAGNGFDHTARLCWKDADQGTQHAALPLASAALLLNSGLTSPFAVDTSADAVNRCGDSNGEIVTFITPFPQGTSRCLNCGTQIPSVFADNNAACIALCEDLTTSLAPPDAATFCASHAHVSTNFPISGCVSPYASACTSAGTLNTNFVDPRTFPEPIAWTDLVGTGTGGFLNNDLTRTAAGTGQFNAGATSMQRIAGGDAYVEFTPAESTLGHAIGFSEISATCQSPCTDSDATLADITFALDLAANGRLYIRELGTLVQGTFDPTDGAWGTYGPGDRFRITVRDRGIDSIVQFSKVIGVCAPGHPCNESVFATLAGVGFPLRVDASLDSSGATLTDVRIVLIQQ